MSIIKRFVVPAGKNLPTQEEWFDTETGRVVPAPTDDPDVAAVAEAPKAPESKGKRKK